MSKELDMMSGLNSYDYGARQYYSVVPAWDRVDPLCEKYYNISPYAYCMGNPIRFIDPDGKAINISGQYQTEALKSIQEYSGESIKLKLDGDKLTYEAGSGKLSKEASLVTKMIDDNVITIDLATVNNDNCPNMTGGCYLGNTVTYDENGKAVSAVAAQSCDPNVLSKMDANTKKGTFIMHEITEAYAGAKVSIEEKNVKDGISVEFGKDRKPKLVQPKTYGKAHKNAAVQQPYSVYEDVMKMVIRNIILEMVKIKKWFMKENRMKLLLYLVFFSLSLYSQNSGEFLLIKVKPLKYDCYVLSFASNHRTYQVLTCYDKNLQKGVLVEKGKKYKLFVDKFPREVRIRIDSLRNMLGDVACESVIKSMKEHYPGEVIDTMYVISNVPLNNDGKYINFGGNKIKCRRKQYYFTSLNLNGLYYIKKDY